MAGNVTHGVTTSAGEGQARGGLNGGGSTMPGGAVAIDSTDSFRSMDEVAMYSGPAPSAVPCWCMQ